MKTSIDNLQQLQVKVGSFDQAAEAELFWGNKENPQLLKGYKGIYNIDKESMATVTSKNYAIIQHNDVVKALHETLEGLNLEVSGVIKDYNNKLILDLVFMNNGVPVKDDADGIRLGIRVMNSYDKTSSYRLEVFGWRLVCSNGMTIGNLLGCREITFHVGKEKPLDTIREITERFIKEALNSHEKLQEYVNACIGDSTEWQRLEKVANFVFKRKKHREAILSRLEEKPVISRWDLYNAVTSYISHVELKPGVERAMERRSRKILKESFAVLEHEIEVRA